MRSMLKNFIWLLTLATALVIYIAVVVTIIDPLRDYTVIYRNVFLVIVILGVLYIVGIAMKHH